MSIGLDPALLEALSTLAAKLGTTVEFMYGVMRRQAFVSGALDVITALLGAALGIYIFRSCVRKARRAPVEDQLFYYIVGGMCILCATIIATGSLFHGTNLIINPDYYAIQELFKLLKDIK